MELKPEVVQTFIDNLADNFQLWCNEQGEQPEPHLLLRYLVDRKIIPAEEVRIGFVVTEVNHLSHCKGISKTAAVHQVEANYGIPESTCFYILDKHQLRHYPKKVTTSN